VLPLLLVLVLVLVLMLLYHLSARMAPRISTHRSIVRIRSWRHRQRVPHALPEPLGVVHRPQRRGDGRLRAQRAHRHGVGGRRA
jgi:hypothetical protein